MGWPDWRDRLPAHELPLRTCARAVGETMGAASTRSAALVASDVAIATRDYEGRRSARTSGLQVGCAKGAKSSVDITYWPMARRAGVQLRTRCRVREILVDDKDMATGVVYYDEHGVEHVQRAEVVVLAATAWARRGCCSTRSRLGSRTAWPIARAGRQEPDDASLGHGARRVRPEPGLAPRAQSCCILSQQFYETDAARASCALQHADHRGLGRSRPRAWASRARHPLGAGHHEAFAGATTARSGSESAARTCPRSATRSRWIRRGPIRTAFRRRRSPTGSARTRSGCCATAWSAAPR